MRQLHLQVPNLSGPDVSDWQTFLQGQRLFHSVVDGFFGPKSDEATRAYQAKAGLTSDGIVGRMTMAQALIDGYRSTTGANLAGMDASVNCSSFAGGIFQADMRFAARYYSNTTAKTLTLPEAQQISKAGVDIVTVFEDSNDSIEFFSAAIGKNQAEKALQLAARIGQPEGTAIYFAADFDPASGEVDGPVSDYFTAVNNVLSAAPTGYTVGVYGSGLTCRVIRDRGLATFTWLAQSTGFQEYAAFLPQADIVQLFPSRILLGGLEIDDDIAQSAQFGGFRIGSGIGTDGATTAT